MNYQSIRAQVENPLLTAFGALDPAIPVYFDNITAAPLNSTTEYVRVNVTFGLTNEPTLTSSCDNARGAIIIRVFTKKGEEKDVSPIKQASVYALGIIAIFSLLQLYSAKCF